MLRSFGKNRQRSFAAAGITQTYLERILGLGYLDTQQKIQVHFLMLLGTGILFVIGVGLFLYDFFFLAPAQRMQRVWPARAAEAAGLPASREIASCTASSPKVVPNRAVTWPNANRAYYRVVAVDAKGNRSGPSELAEAPRPILWSRPVTAARVGSEYRYALAAIRSLGDLRTRVVAGRETMNYWDIESPRFALRQGPGWLKINEHTGVLSGIPDAPGSVPVVVTATIDREVRTLDERALSWGLEKTLATGTQRVGVATQAFTLEVAPR